MAYDDPVNYTKQLVIVTSDGNVTLKQNAAREFQKFLEDNNRFFKIYDTTTKTTTYYDRNSASCGFCKVATLTSGETTGTALPCEDPIPNCPADDSKDDGGDDDGDGGDDDKQGE